MQIRSKTQQAFWKVVESGGQFQVVVGNDVSEVYKHIVAEGNLAEQILVQAPKRKEGHPCSDLWPDIGQSDAVNSGICRSWSGQGAVNCS